MELWFKRNLGIRAKLGSNINFNGSIESLDLDKKYIEQILMTLKVCKSLQNRSWQNIEEKVKKTTRPQNDSIIHGMWFVT